MIGKFFEVYTKKTFKFMTYSLLSLSAGLYLGYVKSSKEAEIHNSDTSLENLQSYKSQDQINHMIDTTNKPAVIYYYQPGINIHYIIRHAFIQSSNRYKDNATFWLVNLTKKFQPAKQEIKQNFPLEHVLLQIRFPKSDCEVKYSNEEFMEEQTYRREFFNHSYYTEDGVQSFLQQNGIKKEDDPMNIFFRVNRKVIFQDLKEKK